MAHQRMREISMIEEIPLEVYLLKASPARIREMCVFTCVRMPSETVDYGEGTSAPKYKYSYIYLSSV